MLPQWKSTNVHRCALVETFHSGTEKGSKFFVCGGVTLSAGDSDEISVSPASVRDEASAVYSATRNKQLASRHVHSHDSIPVPPCYWGRTSVCLDFRLLYRWQGVAGSQKDGGKTALQSPPRHGKCGPHEPGKQQWRRDQEVRAEFDPPSTNWGL